ncbi:hypothetical protein M406DRAFT_346258 [Cryphonectria parasitica EP155]|uniref:Xylanolytic transcriptional activator regulatory domain-containing protein n=1 Tax=Cryphonectria parasitica (strain ATCC 38755 / EP155) TaxID=660469 RepID=A0A9P4Y495_CRYP1|nr:uncharacterized protein M406DRAFT_346258 [Cryphonectria parasitica EP155]KAF3766268.1 hypothetical protein M406DRAFT_346258 [Cryphonectria parasitica EP155]
MCLPKLFHHCRRHKTTKADDWDSRISPSPSDYGSIRVHQSSVSYSGSTHWSAVLDSIAELKSLFIEEDDEQLQDFDPDPVGLQSSFAQPTLLYSGLTHESLSSILQALPERSIVDRLVSRYFNILDMVPGMIHSGQFLREAFTDPAYALPLNGGEYPRQSPQAARTQAEVDLLREKATQCLKLGEYTRGGPYVLETLIIYFLGEVFHKRGVNLGLWIIVGNIVQIALHMGYHRDACHYTNISPFAGEIRRRVWAVILQLDWSFATQLGLPRLIKETHADTLEPRNLYDSDFHEDTAEMPPSRPETEVTPTLYVLAKLRLRAAGLAILDKATVASPRSYDEVLELDGRIEAARETIPPIFKWTGLSSSLGVSSQIIIQRMWLELCIQEMKMMVHRKFLELPYNKDQQYAKPRTACLTAAMKCLDFQQLVNEETQVDGLLYQDRWRISSAVMNTFLLATSILCFYLKTHTGIDGQGGGLGDVASVPLDKIRKLLEKSLVVWSRQSVTSREARKAVAALRYVLGHSDNNARSDSQPSSHEAAPPTTLDGSLMTGFSDLMPDYELLSLGLEPSNMGSSWQTFPANNVDMDVHMDGHDVASWILQKSQILNLIMPLPMVQSL